MKRARGLRCRLPLSLRTLVCVLTASWCFGGTSHAQQWLEDAYVGLGDAFHLPPYEKRAEPPTAHFFETVLFPGGGHLANDHVSKAGVTMLATLIPIPFIIEDWDGDQSVPDLSTRFGYDASRRYYRRQHSAQLLLILSALSYADSIVEAFANYGRHMDDDTLWTFGMVNRVSQYDSHASYYATHLAGGGAFPDFTNVPVMGIDAGGTVYADGRKPTIDSFLPGFFLSTETGRTTSKRLSFDFGLTSYQLTFDWWLGTPLSWFGVTHPIFSRLAPAIGYRWLYFASVKDDSTQSSPNNSDNKFFVEAGDIWVGLLWNNGRRFGREPEGILNRFAAGAGFFLFNAGLVWDHPSSSSASGSTSGGNPAGSAGYMSKRAIERGFMKNIGFKTWATVAAWRFVDVLLDVEWFSAKEQDYPGSEAGPEASLKFTSAELRVAVTF